MKIECIQENLNKGLNIATHIVNKNNSLPILNNILLETQEDNLKITSTNLEVGIEFYIRCKVDIPGKAVVPAQLFNNYISTLPLKNINLSLEDNKLNISCDKFNTKINTLSADDFPIIPEINKKNKYTLSVNDLKNILSRVIGSISNNNSRPEINGVLFSFEDNKLTLVGTDGYRLSEGIISIQNENNTNEQIILPLFTAQEISKILQIEDNNIEIYTSDTQVLFNFENIKLISRVISGNYPDYKQIIPESFKTDFNVMKTDFLSIVKNIGLFADKNINDIKIIVNNNKVTVESKNNEIGENIVELDTEINGVDNSIIFNYQYLIDGLNNISSKNIKINILDENMPALIYGLDNDEKNIYKYILMPIRG